MTLDLSIPERFGKAVDTYVANRTRYPTSLLTWILNETGTGADAHVLDLGCGPGLIANAIAGGVGRVTGVDPSPEMLAAARQDAPANVTYLQGSSDDLSIVEGPIDLVTMGRSFHWMDRPATLVDLDARVPAGGALALLNDKPIKAPENKWWFRLQEIGRAHSKPDPSSFVRMTDDWVPHEPVLLDSPFSDLKRISVFVRHNWTVETLWGHFLSRSATTVEVLGNDLPAFKDAFNAALSEFGTGPFETLTEAQALIARRPGTGEAHQQ
ncbi:MAG: class I SAM-dependent methyltransferase [Pseudomonadota bacterium]